MESIIHEIINNDLLFGKDKEGCIVGAYQLSDTQIRVFNRDKEKVSFHDEPFFPFIFVSDESLLEGFVPEDRDKFWLVKLAGSNFYQCLSIFRSWKAYRGAIDFINNKSYGEGSDSSSESGQFDSNSHIYNKGDAVTQYLLQSGKTLFKGMIFDDLYRMQLDIDRKSVV